MTRWLGPGDPDLTPRTDLATARRLVESVVGDDRSIDADRARILRAIEASRRNDESGSDLVVAPSDHVAHRSARPGHLTGSAFVVDHSGHQAVLLFHRKLRRWLQPGGHADGDTNLAHVAWREATEETGLEGLELYEVPIDLDIHEVRPPNEDAHLHLDVRFVLRAPAGARLVANDESDASRWVSRHDLDRFDLDIGLRRLAARAFAIIDSGDGSTAVVEA